MRGLAIVIAVTAAACSEAHPLGDAAIPAPDAPDARDASITDADRIAPDAAPGSPDAHAGSPDAHAGSPDAHATTPDAGTIGPITGGPCLSGAAGATAYRIRFADGGGTAQVVSEVDGLPGDTADHAGAYGYQIGFTPSFVDPFLGDGGLQLDSSDFVDLQLSTAGLAQITSATLAIYGRSYDTTTSGSFNWQTFDGDGYGEAPTDAVSNVAPYQWYAADMTGETAAGNANAIIRIKAGPSSGSLVVNRIELCMQAQ